MPINLAPGIPIPPPPVDNTNLQAFGKGMAYGLEQYINQRMRQKENLQLLENELEKTKRKGYIELANKIASGEVSLNVPTPPPTVANLPVPQMGLSPALSVAPQGLPVMMPSEEANLPQGEIPALPPTTEQEVRQNVLSGLESGNLPTGFGKSYTITKPKEQKQYAGYTTITPTQDNISDLKKHIPFLSPTVNKPINVPNTVLIKMMGNTQYQDRQNNFEYQNAAKQAALEKDNFTKLMSDPNSTADQQNAQKNRWEYAVKQAADILERNYGIPDYEVNTYDIVQQDLISNIRQWATGKKTTKIETVQKGSDRDKAIKFLKDNNLDINESNIKLRMNKMSK